MENSIKMIEISKVFASGQTGRHQDEVLKERPLLLEVDGREEAAVIITPGNESDWALGHLRCRRMILSMEEVENLTVEPGKVSVTRIIARKGISFPWRMAPGSSGNLQQEAENHTTTPAPLPVKWTTTFAAVHGAIKELASAPLFCRTGCTHVAALARPDGEVLCRIEDAGRHNAVDKAVGWALLHGLNMDETFLALSGRLPADMVSKAIGAGIPLLASVSAVTASGVEAAKKGGITLIGFAREGRMNVYTHPERIRELS